MKSYSVAIQMKAAKKYFLELLFVMWGYYYLRLLVNRKIWLPQ